jgi:hypothetical protein
MVVDVVATKLLRLTTKKAHIITGIINLNEVFVCSFRRLLNAPALWRRKIEKFWKMWKGAAIFHKGQRKTT